MIKEFQSHLNKAGKNDKANNVESNKEPVTEKTIVTVPLTEEHIISNPVSNEPKTNRPIVIGLAKEKPESKDIITEAPSTDGQDKPVKTYGMSLTGDHGLVWNVSILCDNHPYFKQSMVQCEASIIKLYCFFYRI